jgi:hypothetical protein
VILKPIVKGCKGPQEQLVDALESAALLSKSSESGRRVCLRALESERVRSSPLYCGGVPHARSEWLMATFSAAALANMHYAKSARVHAAACPVCVMWCLLHSLFVPSEELIPGHSGRNPSKKQLSRRDLLWLPPEMDARALNLEK